jgi:hypothetical protein
MKKFNFLKKLISSSNKYTTLPTYVLDLKNEEKRLLDYDVKFYDEIEETEEFSFDSWKHKKLQGSDKIRLTNGNKKFIKIAETMPFADHTDHYIRHKPTNPSYLWIDPSSEQPKVLFQLGSQFPPLVKYNLINSPGYL